jgi:hypothetical protein
MPYGRKIVLHCPTGYHARLDQMVQQFFRDGVVFVGVVGEDCARLEAIIDELMVDDGSGQSRFILTSSHPNESVEDALAFARSLAKEYSGEVQVIQL